jgi:hypothetical protein
MELPQDLGCEHISNVKPSDSSECCSMFDCFFFIYNHSIDAGLFNNSN